MSNLEAVNDFVSSLNDLKTTNKANISMLTILADDDKRHASEITKVIENRLREAPPPEKLPVLYLIDSIIKNLPETPYRELFAENIVNNFVNVFSQVDDKVRAAMYKVRQTWCDIFGAKKLFVLDVKVNKIDPKWPIIPLPSDDMGGATKMPHNRGHPATLQPHAPIVPPHVPASVASMEVAPSAPAPAPAPAPTPAPVPVSSASGPTATAPAAAITNESILAKEEELRRLREMHLELQLQKQKALIEKQKEELARIEQAKEMQQKVALLLEQVKAAPLPESAQKLLLETVSSTLLAAQGPSTGAPSSGASAPRDPRKRHLPEPASSASKSDDVLGQMVQNLQEAARCLKSADDAPLADDTANRKLGDIAVSETAGMSPGSKKLGKRPLEPRDATIPAVKSAKGNFEGPEDKSNDSMEGIISGRTAKEEESDLEFKEAVDAFRQISNEPLPFVYMNDSMPKKSAMKSGPPHPPFTAQNQSLEPVQPLKPPGSATALPSGPGPMPQPTADRLPATSHAGGSLHPPTSSGMSESDHTRLLDEAERQLHSGQLTVAQHGELVQQLTQLYDIQRKLVNVRGSQQPASSAGSATTTTTTSLPSTLMAPSTFGGKAGDAASSAVAPPTTKSESKANQPLLPVLPTVPGGGHPPTTAPQFTAPSSIPLSMPPPLQPPFPQIPGDGPPHRLQPPLLPTPPLPPPPVGADKQQGGAPQLLQPASFPPTAHVVLNGEPIDMTIGGPPRTVFVAGKRRVIRINAQSRQILMDGRPVYKLNMPLREIMIEGCRCMIFYHGEMQSIWINSVEYRIRVDAPPQSIVVDGQNIEIVVDSGAGDIIVNGERACAIAHLPCDVSLPPSGTRYRFSFHAPARQIQIDNQLCEVKLDLPVPAVLINGELRGIRFDGPPRVLLVDDDPFEIHTDRAVPLKFGRDDSNFLNVQLGAPAQELIIGEHRYNIGFGTGPVFLMVNGKKYKVELPGPTPEVKLLGFMDAVTGQLYSPETIMPPMPPMPMPPMPPFGAVPFGPPPMPLPPIPPPGAPPFDFRLFPPSQMATDQAQHSGSYAQPSPPLEPIQLPPVPPTSLPPPPLPHMPLPVPTNIPPPAVPILPPLGAIPPHPPPSGGVDLNDLISRLMNKGMLPLPAGGAAPAAPAINLGALAAIAPKLDDKSKVPPIRETPDLTDFNTEMFKTKHQAEITRLYAGVQCGSCGCRFSSPESSRYRLHLDWHFRVNKREREAVRVLRHRAWFLPVLDWISLEQSAEPDQSLGVNESSMMINVNEGQQSGGSGGQRFAEVPVASETNRGAADGGQTADGGRPTQLSLNDGGLQKLPSDTGEERGSNGASVVSCPAASDTKKDTCVVCGEGFETFWNEELDEWHLKDAVCVSGKTYHTVCFEDAARTVASTPSSPTFPPSTPLADASSKLAAAVAVAADAVAASATLKTAADNDDNENGSNAVPICSTPPPPGALINPTTETNHHNHHHHHSDEIKLEPIVVQMEATPAAGETSSS